MAKKRMFSPTITGTDAFNDMGPEVCYLYFQLCLAADDDGFVGSPKRVAGSLGMGVEQLDTLVEKRFCIRFDSGVLAIKHWLIHNTIQKDRYTPTTYIEEFALIGQKKNKAYTLDQSQWYVPEEKSDADTDTKKRTSKKSSKNAESIGMQREYDFPNIENQLLNATETKGE